MKKETFSVHKQTVMANRLGFRIWANKNNKSELISHLDANYVDLDSIPGERVPLDIVSREVAQTAELAQEANLGLAVIDLVDIRITSLGMAVQQALLPLQQQKLTVPLDILLSLISRYFQVLSEVVQVDVAKNDEGIWLSFIPCDAETVSYHQVEGAVYGLVKLVDYFHQSMPEHVRLAHVPDDLNYDLYQRCLGCIPQFCSEKTQLFYRFSGEGRKDNLPLLLSPVIQLHQQQFPDKNFSDRIRLLLSAVLGFVEPTRDNIARVMNLSVSSLQRRLKQDDISFNQLLLAVRQQQVVEYLTKGEITAERLAFLLGYKAKSQFLKAFRQWFGMTPSEYRKTVLLQ